MSTLKSSRVVKYPVGRSKSSRKSRDSSLVATSLLLTGGLLLSACGGGSKSAPTTVATTVATTAAASSTTAVVTTSAAVTTTTAAGSTTTATAAATSVKIRPMAAFSGGGGTLGTITVSRSASSDGQLRIDISNDEVGGSGAMLEASTWNAVTVATLLTGVPPKDNFRFEFSGRVDGPSAGTLLTVAVVALLRGDTIKGDSTMTGTINPDGTVGWVGGIPDKIPPAAKSGMKRILIPVGQRLTPSETGDIADVIKLGADNGSEVTEVRDVYEAYQTLTGKALPRASAGAVPAITGAAFDKLKAKATSTLAELKQTAGEFISLPDIVQQILGPSAVDAQAHITRAQSLASQGLMAGAWTEAWQGLAIARALVATGRLLQTYFVSGTEAFFAQVGAKQAVIDKVTAFFDEISAIPPKNLADASSLMAGYAAGFDALSLYNFGKRSLENVKQSAASLTTEELVGELFAPAVYLELSDELVKYARDVHDIGRGLEGPAISATVKPELIASFVRKASEANFAAFNSLVVSPIGKRYGISDDRATSALANADLDIAISIDQRGALESVKQYLGASNKNAPYAELGFAIANFSRNAVLLGKWGGNGKVELGADGADVTGVSSEALMSAQLELARNQLAGGLSVLTGEKMQPVFEQGLYEYGNVLREGDVSDKFNALGSYYQGFVSSRVLAYLGGFSTKGLA
jgi:uncharacterized protein